ncbi:MAG TPA: hypothetical protein VNH65_07710 [Candidatus Acidoferrum sp.]|nr:hypothetical protein [Candidatus Acidoferrum sp.]
MLRNRFLISLGLCILAASAAWADDVGYVDCSKNSDGTQVFAKPRKSPDVVASVPCGERFTILVYGFFFSRIQTKDGQVGYVYSSLIAIDRAAAAAPQAPSLQTAAEKTKIPSTRSADSHAQTTAAAKPQTAVAQPVGTQGAGAVTATPVSPTTSPASTSNVAETVQTKTQANPAGAADQPAPVQPGTTSPAGLTTPATTVSASTSSAADAAASVAQPNTQAPAQSEPGQAQPTASQPAAAASPETVSPGTAASAPSSTAVETPLADAQPASSAARDPTPAPAQPVTPAIRPADARTTWEKPLPSVRAAPLIELYGGYAFARLDGGGGAASNLSGALGSFGYNFKPWLQVVADTSYSVVTSNGAKNVLYGNHYGVRYFHRGRLRWGITPFAEGLVGGSRADTTVSGAGGYSISANCISFKVGGGLDIHPSRRWEIRLFDVDYYRTSFGTGVYQNNYWASAGVVLRLFGGRVE